MRLEQRFLRLNKGQKEYIFDNSSGKKFELRLQGLRNSKNAIYCLKMGCILYFRRYRRLNYVFLNYALYLHFMYYDNNIRVDGMVYIRSICCCCRWLFLVSLSRLFSWYCSIWNKQLAISDIS